MFNCLKLQGGGESDQVGADTEAGTGARRNRHAGNVCVQDTKSGCSGKRNQRHLVQIERAFGNGVCRDCNHDTFD